jgi:hypothetical protein
MAIKSDEPVGYRPTPVHSYLPRLSEHDLACLEWFATECERLRKTATRLCDWLAQVVSDERERRHAANDAAESLEADILTVDAVNWEDDEMGAALTALQVMRRAADDEPRVIEFIEEVDSVFRQHVVARMKARR